MKRFVQDSLAVAIEAGNQTAWVHEVLVQLGAQVKVVNPRRVKLIAENRCKADKVDVKTVCQAQRLDGLLHPVHMPSSEARFLCALLAARRQLVAARSNLCKVVRRMLRIHEAFLLIGCPMICRNHIRGFC